MSGKPSERAFDAVMLDEADNVATLLRAVDAGETVRVGCRHALLELVAVEAIAFGHKLAVAAIARGQPVVKHGSPIGRARAPIDAGAHVHVHNLVSERARPGRA